MIDYEGIEYIYIIDEEYIRNVVHISNMLQLEHFVMKLLFVDDCSHSFEV